MKTSITAKFLAFRKSPKAVLAKPRQQEEYSFIGFTSPNETVLDRMGRLVEARARGMVLDQDNEMFFRMHRSFLGGSRVSAKRRDLAQLRAIEFENEYIRTKTRGHCNGGKVE